MTHAGVRMPMAAGFAIAAGGMLLLSGASAGGSYLGDVLPGMLVAGLGLGVGPRLGLGVDHDRRPRRRDRDALRAQHHRPRDRRLDRHRRPRRRSPPARPDAAGAGAISDAFLAAAAIAAAAGLVALVVLPSAATFLPKLRLAPRVAIH